MTLPARLYRHADWERELEARGEALAKAGMRVKYVHLPYDYPAADDAEGWARYDEAVCRGVDWTRRYGADCAAIHPRTFMTEDYDPEQEYEDALAFLRPFCEYAHGADVVLAIEIMRGAGRSVPARIRRFGTDIGDLIRMADALDEGICWDTGHAQISMQDPCRSIFRVGRRLRIALTASTAKRARFSALPPYSSVRLLNTVELKLPHIRSPCTCTISNPALTASTAALPKPSVIFWIFFTDSLEM